ncbi:MAG: hypothetical protein ACO1SV_21415 [Fimbriimonas sp.]
MDQLPAILAFATLALALGRAADWIKAASTGEPISRRPVRDLLPPREG